MFNQHELTSMRNSTSAQVVSFYYLSSKSIKLPRIEAMRVLPVWFSLLWSRAATNGDTCCQFLDGIFHSRFVWYLDAFCRSRVVRSQDVSPWPWKIRISTGVPLAPLLSLPCTHGNPYGCTPLQPTRRRGQEAPATASPAEVARWYISQVHREGGEAGPRRSLKARAVLHGRHPELAGVLPSRRPHRAKPLPSRWSPCQFSRPLRRISAPAI
jgi:hypothetical protein